MTMFHVVDYVLYTRYFYERLLFLQYGLYGLAFKEQIDLVWRVLTESGQLGEQI